MRSLFTSANQVMPINTTAPHPIFTLGGLGLLIDPLKTYAIVVSSEGIANGVPPISNMGIDITSGAQYAAGRLFLNNVNNASIFNPGTTWSADPNGPGIDMRFDALFSTFIATPEASHVLLAAMAGLALVGFARRRFAAAA